MNHAEMKNGPHFEMWVIGIAAGLVAAAVMYIVGQYGIVAAGFVGALVALVVSAVFGMPPARIGALPQDEDGDDMPVQPAPVHASPVMAQQAVMTVPADVMAPPVAAVQHDGPARISGPREGIADNLKHIEGIGPAMEKLVNDLGFYHFDQIAGWSDSDVAWVDANMKTFKGRIARDKWVAQAKIISVDGIDAFRTRAKLNDY